MLTITSTSQRSSMFRAKPQRDDRRASRRTVFHMRAEGMRLDNTIAAHRRSHVSFAVHDCSLGGIAAVADQPLDLGERVALFFPPFGTTRGCDRYGSVVRCTRNALGYDVGIRFDMAEAA